MQMTTEAQEPINKGSPGKATRSAAEEEERNIRLKLPKIISYEEIDRFLLAIDDLEDLVACRIMLFAGLRVDEASNVRVRDIHPESQSIFVNLGKGGKDRYAPCDVATLALAKAYARSVELKDDDLLFHYSTRTLQRHVTEVIAPKAGINWGMTCHTLRHTCATWQLDKGIPLEVVKNNLGHTDIATTQIYLHLNVRQRSRVYSDCTRFGI